MGLFLPKNAENSCMLNMSFFRENGKEKKGHLCAASETAEIFRAHDDEKRAWKI